MLLKELISSGFVGGTFLHTLEIDCNFEQHFDSPFDRESKRR